jgi:hypothetical protein
MVTTAPFAIYVVPVMLGTRFLAIVPFVHEVAEEARQKNPERGAPPKRVRVPNCRMVKVEHCRNSYESVQRTALF